MEGKDREYTFEKLKGADNYVKWKRNMLMTLHNAKLGDLIDGSWKEPNPYPMPTAPSADDEERSYQRQKDIRAFNHAKQQCVSKIIMMCVPEVQTAIIAKEERWEPIELWQYLKGRYTRTGWSTKWALFKRFSEVDLDHKLVQHNPEKFEAVIQDIHTKMMDLKMDTSEIIRLLALNAIADHNPIVAGILNEQARKEEKLPDLAELFSIIREYVGNNSLVSTNTANFAKRQINSQNQNQDQGQKQKQHGKPNYHQGKYYYVDKNACYICKKGPHDNCNFQNPDKAPQWFLEKAKYIYELRKKEEDSDSGNRNNKLLTKEQKKNISCTATVIRPQQTCFTSIQPNSTTIAPQTIILDCGATSHIFANKSMFTELRKEPSIVITGSGQQINATELGKVELTMQDSNIILTLNDVIFCPEFGHNLMSTVPLNENGVTVKLNAHKPTEFQQNNQTFGYADLLNRQYVIRATTKMNNNLAFASATSSTAELWHARMGHLGWNTLMKLPNHATNININGPAPKGACGPCQLGGSKRKVSYRKMTRATEVLGRIHADLAGPFPPTREGYTCYKSFLDDASAASWVYSMKRKSEAFTKWKEFRAMIENQTGKKIQRLRTDNGGEFTSDAFQEDLKEAGIQWEPSAPYTHEQNGRIERLNYTLMAPTRSVLKASKLPKGLWAEIIKAISYLRNRSLTNNDKNVTSFEFLNDEQPDLKHIRILGSRAWVHIPKEKRKKHDDRSWQGILVGYEATNQYRIYNPINGKTTIHRDVVIDESNTYSNTAHPSKLFEEQWNKEDDRYFEIESPLIDTSEFDNDDIQWEGKPTKSSSPPEEPRMITPQSQSPLLSSAEYESLNEDEDQAHRGEESSDSNDPDPQPRRSERERKAPILPKGTFKYDSNKSIKQQYKSANTATVNSANTYILNQIPKSHVHMVNTMAMLAQNYNVEGNDEPATLQEAQLRADWPRWFAAMKEEMKYLVHNETWDLIDESSAQHKALTGRWVFRLKKDRNGNIIKYKARWVAHGYKQKYGQDYQETFATVVKPVSYKALLGISVLRGFSVHHMDVVTAFLCGFLDELVYIEQPHYFQKPGLVCKLNKALYGLKQSPRVWYETLTDFLKKLGFTRSRYDYGIFISDDKQAFIAIYVDDLLIFGSNDQQINEIQKALSNRFKMTDLGPVSHYLGMEIDLAVGKHATIKQTAYLKKTLERFGMADCSSSTLPMEPGTASSLLPSNEQADQQTISWYQSAIGSLLWPALHTRPDIIYAVSILARYNSNPSKQHCSLVQKIFKYIKGTLDYGLTFRSSESSDLIGYTDSDFAGLVDGRKSTGGFAFILAGAPISHQSKLQATVALSTCEAEYMAMCEAGKEAIWCGQLLQELGHQINTSMVLNADNQGSMALAQNPEHHKRSKHIDIRYHWIREQVEKKAIELHYIPTKEMVADGFTKPLPVPAFKRFVHQLGLYHKEE